MAPPLVDTVHKISPLSLEELGACGTEENPRYPGGEIHEYDYGLTTKVECSPKVGESVEKAGIAVGQWVRAEDGRTFKVTAIKTRQYLNDEVRPTPDDGDYAPFNARDYGDSRPHTQVYGGPKGGSLGGVISYNIKQVEPTTAPPAERVSERVNEIKDGAVEVIDHVADKTTEAMHRAWKKYGDCIVLGPAFLILGEGAKLILEKGAELMSARSRPLNKQAND